MIKNIIVGIILIVGLSRCAKEVAPTGGKRDIIPPKVVKYLPAEKTINFQENKIELEFDEIIEANSLKQELVITPAYNGKYKVKAINNKVQLIFETPFDSNTTYTFNFRKGIKDLNEKNPANNLKVIFSTGNDIDSLDIDGMIRDLFTNKPVQNCFVGLYKIDKKDSIPILKRKPYYFLSTDSSGVFKFENIKNGNYKCIAFTDKNNNLLYNEEKELLGFINDTLKLNKDTNLETIFISKADTTAPKPKRNIQRFDTYTIKMSENLKEVKVESNQNDSLKYRIKDDEIIFFNRKSKYIDSLTVKIMTKDSLGNSSEFEKKIKFLDEKREKTKKEQLKMEFEPSNKTQIKPATDIKIKFEYPIQKMDSIKMQLWEDTLYQIPYQLKWKDDNKTEIEIKFVEKPKNKIKLKIDNAAFINIKSDTSGAVQLENELLKNENTGIIEGRVEGEEQTYITELREEESQKLVEKIISKGQFLFEKIKPGNYVLRIIDDENQNGIWDGSKFFENKQAEKIYQLSTPIKIRANFELRDIIVPKKRLGEK